MFLRVSQSHSAPHSAQNYTIIYVQCKGSLRALLIRTAVQRCGRQGALHTPGEVYDPMHPVACLLGRNTIHKCTRSYICGHTSMQRNMPTQMSILLQGLSQLRGKKIEKSKLTQRRGARSGIHCCLQVRQIVSLSVSIHSYFGPFPCRVFKLYAQYGKPDEDLRRYPRVVVDIFSSKLSLQ